MILAESSSFPSSLYECYNPAGSRLSEMGLVSALNYSVAGNGVIVVVTMKQLTCLPAVARCVQQQSGHSTQTYLVISES